MNSGETAYGRAQSAIWDGVWRLVRITVGGDERGSGSGSLQVSHSEASCIQRILCGAIRRERVQR